MPLRKEPTKNLSTTSMVYEKCGCGKKNRSKKCKTLRVHPFRNCVEDLYSSLKRQTCCKCGKKIPRKKSTLHINKPSRPGCLCEAYNAKTFDDCKSEDSAGERSSPKPYRTCPPPKKTLVDLLTTKLDLKCKCSCTKICCNLNILPVCMDSVLLSIKNMNGNNAILTSDNKGNSIMQIRPNVDNTAY